MIMNAGIEASQGYAQSGQDYFTNKFFYSW